MRGHYFTLYLFDNVTTVDVALADAVYKTLYDKVMVGLWSLVTLIQDFTNIK